MPVFLFTDIEGSTRLWEEHTAEMGAVIARHDALLQQAVAASGGRITKHTGDGITAAFEAGEPLACALEAQTRFAHETWGAIGELRIRVGLHAGAAEWIAGVEGQAGDYFGPPVNCAARIMAAAWGGQILLTPEVTSASRLPAGARLKDLGLHLLRDVGSPQQLYQLLHPQLARHDFPLPRTLSGQSIRHAVAQRGEEMAGLAPTAMGVRLMAVTLTPALQGELDPESGALEGSLGVLEELGALSLHRFVASLTRRLRTGERKATPELELVLEDELTAEWRAGGETALALRADASRLLQAVQGVEGAMVAASGDVKEALAQGLADLGGQFAEFRWMLGGVQEALAEVQAGQRAQVALQLEQAAMQREQLELQREQQARTEEILQLQREWVPEPLPAVVPEAAEPPAFLEAGEDRFQRPVFVGRQRELDWLQGFLEQAVSGQGTVMFVTGGPGRGKTALLGEFSRRAMEAHPDLLAASGNCNAYSGVGDPYLPFREVLGMLSGEVETHWAAGTISRDHALRLWQALPAAVEALLAHGPHVVPALVPGEALLARASAAGPGEPWLAQLRERVARAPGDAGGLEQSHLFQQVTNLLQALAEAHPLLLILDDLQWIDTASAGLLFHLGRRLEGSCILVVGTYRAEEVALGRAGERHPLETVLTEFKRAYGDVWLDLAEVPEPEGRRFVDALLETEPNRLGEDFRRALFAHTGGHPLFTVELLRTMQERGDLVLDNSGCWVEGPALDWETLPARVEGVIEARIGRLEEDLREILSVASVEGEDFTAQVVARVQEIGQRQALRRLSRELEARHRLVREQSALRLGHQRLSRYRFAHALFQQYLYSHLGDGERALLHSEVARVLEELYQGHPEGVAAIAPQLARHFTEAGDEGHALRYLILAGDGALAAYANGEAEAYYRRALDLAPGESERAHLLSGLGEALFRGSRFREAIQTWGQGIERYRALEDSDGLARLYARSSWATNLANDPAAAMQLCLEGLASVEGAPGGPGQARLLYETARAYWWNGLGEEARTFARQALEMAERLGDVEVQAHALAAPGLLGLPSVEDRWQALARAVDLAESHGLLDAASRAHHNLSTLAAGHRGDYRAAREHLRRAAELYGQAGDTAGQVLALDGQAGASMSCGELEEAGRTLTQMRALLKDLSEPTYAAQAALVTEAWYLFFRGEWAECARLARALRTAARERGDDPELAGAGSILAIAVLESGLFGGDAGAGTWEEAEAAFAEHIEITDRSLNVHGSIYGRAFLGLLRLAQGRPGKARRLLAEARQKAREELALPEYEGFLRWLAALVLGAEENWREALAAHEATAELFARYGLRFHWARARLDWAEAHTARGEPGDRERSLALLRESLAAFEEMGSPGYAAVAQQRLDEQAAK